MSQTLVRPSSRVLFIPEKQPAKPLTAPAEGGIRVRAERRPAHRHRRLVSGVRAEERDQVLLGVTGSGKTFTMAKVIEAVQKPDP